MKKECKLISASLILTMMVGLFSVGCNNQTSGPNQSSTGDQTSANNAEGRTVLYFAGHM